MIRLSLLAHAPTAAERLFRFPSDEGIEPIASAVADHIRARIGPCDAVWHGPERRAVETANALGLAAAPCAAWRAWSAGAWAGQPVAWVAEHDPEAFRAWRTDPDATPNGGESLRALIGRVTTWLTTQAPVAGRVLIIADPAVIRAAIVAVLDAGPSTFWRIDVVPLSLSIVQRADDAWRLRKLGIEFRMLDSSKQRTLR